MRRSVSAASFLVLSLTAAAARGDVVTAAGPPCGADVPRLAMGQAEVIHRMNRKGNYTGFD